MTTINNHSKKIERLKYILGLQAESYDLDQQHTIAKAVLEMYDDCKKESDPDLEVIGDDYGNVYITKGKPLDNGLYPCVVAHLDQVHDVNSLYREIVEDGDVIFAVAKNKLGDYEQVGTGSDDLSGVWLCLELLLSIPSLKVVFFIDGEVGCLGSESSDVNFFKDCTFVLQGDRRSDTNDFITYTNGVNVSSKEFRREVKPILTKYGYKQTSGIATDAGQLVINGIGCCTANISCGYFKEHTKREVSSIKLSLNCLELMTSIIEVMSYKRWPMPKQTRKKPKFRILTNSSGEVANITPSTQGEIKPPFEGMPIPTEEEIKDLFKWNIFRGKWSDWANPFFTKTYGKSRYVLNVPTPYEAKYTNLGAIDFLIDLYTWKQMNESLPTLASLKTFDTFLDEQELCPQCDAYDITSYLSHLGGGHYRCPTCYLEIDTSKINIH